MTHPWEVLSYRVRKYVSKDKERHDVAPAPPVDGWSP